MNLPFINEQLYPNSYVSCSLFLSYHCGERFLLYGSKGSVPQECILACIEPSVLQLFNLQNGDRWSEPVAVHDVYAVTPREMWTLAHGRKFERITA